jgi:hypothetical protein
VTILKKYHLNRFFIVGLFFVNLPLLYIIYSNYQSGKGVLSDTTILIIEIIVLSVFTYSGSIEEGMFRIKILAIPFLNVDITKIRRIGILIFIIPVYQIHLEMKNGVGFTFFFPLHNMGHLLSIFEQLNPECQFDNSPLKKIRKYQQKKNNK